MHLSETYQQKLFRFKGWFLKFNTIIKTDTKCWNFVI